MVPFSNGGALAMAIDIVATIRKPDIWKNWSYEWVWFEVNCKVSDTLNQTSSQLPLIQNLINKSSLHLVFSLSFLLVLVQWSMFSCIELYKPMFSERKRPNGDYYKNSPSGNQSIIRFHLLITGHYSNTVGEQTYYDQRAFGWVWWRWLSRKIENRKCQMGKTVEIS